MERLDQKVAVVIGAGSSAGGLSNGMATAVLFAREGAKVFCVDIEAGLMRETEERIRAEGGECVLHECRVEDGPGLERMAQACVAQYGRIDILFNNVGIQATGGPLDLSEEDFDRLMRVNVKGMFLACRAVLPQMLRQGAGAIVNNSSVGAWRYSYPAMGYTTSKGAVVSLTMSIGVQYAARGIRCNAVLPGFISTERITSRLQRQFGDKWTEQVGMREKQVPAGRLGDPWDVAYAVLYLASDEAKYVTGTTLVVDGGLSQSTTGHVEMT